MDFKLTENLDFEVINGIIQNNDNSNNETALLTALFTNKREGTEEGYWVDELFSSLLWKYDSSRINQEVADNIKTDIQDVLILLVNDDIYENMNNEVTYEDGESSALIKIEAYKDNEVPVLSKSFKVGLYD